LRTTGKTTLRHCMNDTISDISSSTATLPLSIIIFSKDRACQLDSLLTSISDHLHHTLNEITILYRASDVPFQQAYDLLRQRAILPDITWLRENNFREDVRGLINSANRNANIMFLVDDDIVYRPCVLDDCLKAFTEQHLFISLRADRNYTGDTAPVFLSQQTFLEWKWNYSKRRTVTWNYPFSVDGNIFHCSHLRRAVEKLPFRAPNSFEGNLHSYRHCWWVKRKKLALAPLQASVYNNPLNNVQTEGETWHRDISTGFLNDAYLSGKRIDNGILYTLQPDAIHHASPITFTG
jgi:hypothetical protein